MGLNTIYSCLIHIFTSNILHEFGLIRAIPIRSLLYVENIKENICSYLVVLALLDHLRVVF